MSLRNKQGAIICSDEKQGEAKILHPVFLLNLNISNY